MDQTLPTLHRGLDTIEVFLEGGPQLSAREIQARLGIPRATLYRVLRVLEHRGYLRRDEQTGGYQLGFRLLQLSAAAQDQIEIAALANGILHRINEETKENTSLAMLEGVEVVFVRTFESLLPLRLSTRSGFRAPVYCTASGKAILAFAPPSKLEEVVAAGFAPLTPRTVKSAKTLDQQLARIRKEGVSVARGEYRETGRAVFAPVFDHQGDVAAALGVSGPADRFSEARISALSERVREGAAELSKRLGARPGGRKEIVV
ncbi:MAG: IclR family transcriptional regulator [bacterium]|nr:IclR family transcriptional regulator [bacterium]